jgi:hypothetical protein
MDKGHIDATHDKRVVHMQNIDDLTKTYCGRSFYRQKHVTTRFKDCTCKICWVSICAQYKGVEPGDDFVITQMR